ncbi:MAG: CBS domain-containing protein [Leptospiraceae bacterium]|nr:CBS domain-containing protein [Leptospiraceae bacterium]
MSTEINRNKPVQDVMIPLDKFPVLKENTIFKEALEAMSKFNLGIACIIDSNSKLLGIVTDGDVRRKLLKIQKPFSALFVDDALDHCIKSPVTISQDSKLIDAVEVMEAKHVWDLPVVDSSGKLIGLMHLHPAVKAILS